MQYPEIPRFTIRSVAGLFILLAQLLGGCTGGDSETTGGTANPLWVTIETTSPSVQTSTIDLRGKAYCDNCPASEVAFGYCPAIQGPLSSSVDITWKNRTTGATGDAIHGIYGSCSCLFSYCFTSYSHQWMAYGVPLDIGENELEATASDISGATATDTVTLTRIPASPVELTAVAGKGEVTLDWSNVTGATAYNLYWSTSADLTVSTGTKLAGVTSLFVHTGLTDGVTHYYLVTAVTGGYESPPSPTVFATPGWRTEVLAPTTSSTDRRATSIAMDSAANTHVHYAYDECTHYSTGPGNFIYCDAYVFHNYYSTDTGGTWVGLAIGPSPYVDANIAIDSADEVHVGYADNHGIIHAVYANGAWTPETVDAAGWCASSFALDGTDKAHFAYYASSASAGYLMYATYVSGAWVHETVDAFTQDIGCGVPADPLSIAVDANGTGHIAYAGRYPDYGLKYAVKQGGTWVTSMIDTGYIAKLSAALDTDGKMHVAYSDGAHHIKYAHQDATGAWVIEVIENGSGDYPSLALDASGYAHISYVSYSSGGQLVYATNSAGSWSYLPIDAADSEETAVALDSQGKVHVSYFNGGSLKSATNK
ncbi:MAG TPA: hypothetical protein VMJ33_03355 [Gallionella sp.]|nr:hypothetical protein [Gallionella sp.]